MFVRISGKKRYISLPLIRSNSSNDCTTEPIFNAHKTPVVWTPQDATDPAEAIVQSLVPLLSLSSASKIWSNSAEAEYILHLDGLPLPQYFTNLLRPFMHSKNAIHELSSLGGGTLCGICYSRIWVCNLDNLKTAYEDLTEGDERIVLLRRGLLLLRKGVTAQYGGRSSTPQKGALSVGLSASETQILHITRNNKHSDVRMPCAHQSS